MTGREGRRASAFVAAVALLVLVAAGLGPGGAEQPIRTGSDAAIGAGGLGLHPEGLLDTRAQRSTAVEHRERVSHEPGLAGRGGPGPGATVSTSARSAGPVRADHPRSRRQIRLRGPPGSSA